MSCEKPKKAEKQASRNGRRAILKSMVIGGGAAGAFSGLPTSWKKPMVASVMLPAHAQTSPPSSTGSLSDCSSDTMGDSGISFSEVFGYVYTFTVDGTNVYNAFNISGTIDINSGVFSVSGSGNSSYRCKDGDYSVYGSTITGTVGGTGTSTNGYRLCDGIQVSEFGGTGPVSAIDPELDTFTFDVNDGYFRYCPDLFMYPVT